MRVFGRSGGEPAGPREDDELLRTTLPVRVRSQLSPGDPHTTVVSIEDEGSGMPEDDLHAANALLEEVPEVDLGLGLVRLADVPGLLDDGDADDGPAADGDAR